MIGHEAAGTAFRAGWRAHRQRVREGEASAWIASFEYEPDARAGRHRRASRARRSRCRCATISAIPRRGGRCRALRGRGVRGARGRRAGRRGARAHRAHEVRPHARRARRRARRASTPTRSSSTASASARSRSSACRSSSSARSAWRSGIARPLRRRSSSGYWNGYRNYLPTDAERRARRLRDRHLAVPARSGRARHLGRRPGAGAAALTPRRSCLTVPATSACARAPVRA